MKDWILIPIMLAVFVFGYFVMTKVDGFIEEYQHSLNAKHLKTHDAVRIAAETPTMLHSISSALECCSEADPYMEFSLSSGRFNGLLEQYSQDELDILLIEKDHARQLSEENSSVLIPYEKSAPCASMLGLPIHNTDKGREIVAVWKKNHPFKNRDLVVLALEHAADGF